MASETRLSESTSEGKSPPGLKRETLTSRAKRVIGRALDSPEKNNTSLPGKKGPPKKEPNRRREQVLQAQRTHRQRTQGYIRELEREVLRLRESEITLQKQNEELDRRNKALEQKLASHNIAVPNGVASPNDIASSNGVPSPNDPLQYPFGLDLQHHSPFLSTDGDITSGPSEDGHTPMLVRSDTETVGSGSNVGFPSDVAKDPFVNVDFTGMAGVELEHICNIEPEWLIPPEFEPPKVTNVLPQKVEAAKPGEFPSLNSQQALDFVLGLESVCFPHIAYDQINHPPPPPDVPEANRGPNHVYSATTNLIHHRLPKDPRAEVFQFPKPDLDKMFQSSLHVNFGTDVTPIQIWANLVRISGLGYVISGDFVDVLMDELKRYVRCNGFGAVVDKETISALFEFYFPGQKYIVDWPED